MNARTVVPAPMRSTFPATLRIAEKRRWPPLLAMRTSPSTSMTLLPAP
jgi:hypothetical protein